MSFKYLTTTPKSEVKTYLWINQYKNKNLLFSHIVVSIVMVTMDSHLQVGVGGSLHMSLLARN